MNDEDKKLPAKVDKEVTQSQKETQDTKDEEVEEVIDPESMAPEFKKVMSVFQASIMRGGMMPHPLVEKFTPEHISKFLDYSKEDDVREHAYKSSTRYFSAFYVLIFIGVFIFLTIFFLQTNNNVLYFDLLKGIGIFLGGFGGGYGFKIFRDKRNNS